jgi:ABC-type molybdate transport system permease subunit
MASKMRDILAAILMLAIVILGFIAVFRPGLTGEWTIKVFGLEVKGSDVALAFAVLLFALLVFHPGLREAFTSMARSATRAARLFFTGFRR